MERYSHASVQDVLLRDALLKLLELPADKLLLKDVKPEYDLQQRRRERELYPEAVIAGELKRDTILNRTVTMSRLIRLPGNEGTITLSGQMKVKNYGNFNRMFSDPRLMSFLRLYKFCGFDEVDYSYLELREFDQYDRVFRPAMFSLIQQLEKKILDKFTSIRENNRNGFIEFWSFARIASGGDEMKRILLVMFRNAVAHNYYPEFRPMPNWGAKDKIRFAPRLDQEREQIKSAFQTARAQASKDKPALLIEVLYDYARKLYNIE